MAWREVIRRAAGVCARAGGSLVSTMRRVFGPAARRAAGWLRPVTSRAGPPLARAGLGLKVGCLAAARGTLWAVSRAARFVRRFCRRRFSRYPPLTRKERNILERQVAAGDLLWIFRTRTRTDVGMWFHRARIWACFVPGKLVLFAGGSRPYVDEVPATALRESRYNHVTGQLILAPEAGARRVRLRMPPLESHELLAWVRGERQPGAEPRGERLLAMHWQN